MFAGIDTHKDTLAVAVIDAAAPPGRSSCLLLRENFPYSFKTALARPTCACPRCAAGRAACSSRLIRLPSCVGRLGNWIHQVLR